MDDQENQSIAPDAPKEKDKDSDIPWSDFYIAWQEGRLREAVRKANPDLAKPEN
jgi:hypothetical protein